MLWAVLAEFMKESVLKSARSTTKLQRERPATGRPTNRSLINKQGEEYGCNCLSAKPPSVYALQLETKQNADADALQEHRVQRIDEPLQLLRLPQHDEGAPERRAVAHQRTNASSYVLLHYDGSAACQRTHQLWRVSADVLVRTPREDEGNKVAARVGQNVLTCPMTAWLPPISRCNRPTVRLRSTRMERSIMCLPPTSVALIPCSTWSVTRCSPCSVILPGYSSTCCRCLIRP